VNHTSRNCNFAASFFRGAHPRLPANSSVIESRKQTIHVHLYARRLPDFCKVLTFAHQA